MSRSVTASEITRAAIKRARVRRNSFIESLTFGVQFVADQEGSD